MRPIEILWSKELLKEYGLIMASDLVGKSANWFVFDELNQLKFKSQTSIDGELVPPKKFLLPRNKPTYRNPYGVAELSKCYWPVIFKKGNAKFWIKYAEKYGSPFAIGKTPAGYADIKVAALLDRLQKLVQDACAVVPSDIEIDFKDASNSGAGNKVYYDIITWANSEISKAILGHTGALDSTPGKLGSEDAAMEVMNNHAMSDKHLVEKTLNEFIQWFCQYNFPEKTYPTFRMFEEFKIDKTQADRDKLMFDMGVRFTPKYWGEKYNLDEDDFTVKEDAPVPGNPTDNPNEPPAFSHFAKKDQTALDKMLDSMTDKQLQDGAEQFLGPIFAIFDKAKSYEQALVMLRSNKLFKSFTTTQLDELLTRAVFTGDVGGRLSAGIEK